MQEAFNLLTRARSPRRRTAATAPRTTCQDVAAEIAARDRGAPRTAYAASISRPASTRTGSMDARARAFSTSTGSNRDTGIVAGFFAAATGLATSPSRSGCTEPEIASPAPRRGRLGGLQSPEKRGNHMRSAVPASEVTTESTMTEVTRRAAHMVNTARDQVAVIETPVAMMQMMMKTEVVASIEVAVIE